MGQFYKILTASPMGEPWESHGKQNQTYWCQVEGEELAVSISKQVPNVLNPGQHVYGDLMKATSQRGTNYWKFKSSQVPEGVARPADSPAQAVAQQAVGVNVSAPQPEWFQPWANLIKETHKMIKQLHGGLEEEPKEDKKGVEVIAGAPLDEETQAQLDGIFAEPEPEV